MLTIDQCHDFGLAADVALYDANTATGRERNMVRLYAYASLDRYHGMIEAMGRAINSPELLERGQSIGQEKKIMNGKRRAYRKNGSLRRIKRAARAERLCVPQNRT